MGSLGCKHELEWVLAAATDLAMYLSQAKQVFSKSGPGDITCYFLRTSLEKAAKSANLKKLHHLPPQLNKKAQDMVKPKYCNTFISKYWLKGPKEFKFYYPWKSSITSNLGTMGFWIKQIGIQILALPFNSWRIWELKIVIITDNIVYYAPNIIPNNQYHVILIIILWDKFY